MKQELRAAKAAARAAGRFLMREWAKRGTLRVESKREADYVTRVDRGSEARVVRFLRKRFPRDSILGEEGGVREGASASRRWIIDPLDGTTNYLHGFPLFAVSIAFEADGVLRAGAVFDPVHGEMFAATRGGGAFLNGERIRVSSRPTFRHALAATGFPFKEFRRMDFYMRIFRAVARTTAGIRRPGVASLDLCYLACGRVDFFWELGLAPWDVAAGALIVEEAGGSVTDLAGGGDFLDGDIAASNGKVHRALLDLIARAREGNPTTIHSRGGRSARRDRGSARPRGGSAPGRR